MEKPIPFMKSIQIDSKQQVIEAAYGHCTRNNQLLAMESSSGYFAREWG